MMFHVKQLSETQSQPDPLSSPVIRQTLAQNGICISEDQSRALAKHAELVIQANREFNLTRITDPADVLILQVLDSALAIDAVQATPRGQLVDIGSGAGYPGVVLAILTDRPTLLVESVRKKADFLSRVAFELGLEVGVYAGRAEDLAREHAEEATCVVARALAPLPSIVELAAPLLRHGGRLVAMKGCPGTDELVSGAAAALQCGMRQVEVQNLGLSLEHRRALVIYERVGRPRVRLPRRIGLAQHAPLG